MSYVPDQYSIRVERLQEQIVRQNAIIIGLNSEIEQLRKEAAEREVFPQIGKDDTGRPDLFGALNPGDTILYSGQDLRDNWKNPIKRNLTFVIKYIDKITKAAYVISDAWSGTISYRSINEHGTRIAEAGQTKDRLPVLQVTKNVEEEVFLWHYDETPRDRRYIKYCQRMGRDYPRKKVWDKKEELSVDEDQLIMWLREVIRLKPEMGRRIIALLTPEISQPIDLQGHQET